MTCGLNVDLDVDVAQRTLMGRGGVMCSGDAAMEIETCVQVAEPGSSDFTDLQCESKITTAGEYDATTVVGCAVGAGKSYRTKMTSVVQGRAEDPTFSDPKSCE